MTFADLTGQNTWEDIFPPESADQYLKSENCVLVHQGEDVVISSRKESAWISSSKEFSNFNLHGEFHLGDAGTGRISFRLNNAEERIPEINGYTVNFDADPDQQNSLGSIINLARAKWLDSLNFNQWIPFEIQAMGDLFKIFINDQLVAETHSRRSSTGFIKIELHNSGMQFRNLKIKQARAMGHSGPMTEDYLRNYPGVSYTQIFDGKSLEGWSPTGTSKWEIREGDLYGESGSEGGFLVSQNSYKNFHLKFKFKIIKEDNSGIFIRKPEAAKTISLENSIECNIYDHNGFTHAFSTGALVGHSRAWSQMIDYQDWNTGEIYALEDHIIMYINGLKASEAHLPDFNHGGQLCLQAGLQLALPEKGPSEVYFKDIRIKCIDQ